MVWRGRSIKAAVLKTTNCRHIGSAIYKGDGRTLVSKLWANNVGTDTLARMARANRRSYNLLFFLRIVGASSDTPRSIGSVPSDRCSNRDCISCPSILEVGSAFAKLADIPLPTLACRPAYKLASQGGIWSGQEKTPTQRFNGHLATHLAKLMKSRLVRLIGCLNGISIYYFSIIVDH